MDAVMNATDVIEALTIPSWNGPFTAEDRARALTALEDGKVVMLPRLEFTLHEAEFPFLDSSALDNSRKNISYDPATGTCGGTDHQGPALERLASMMDRYASSTEHLVRQLFPSYDAALTVARTSFRPAEISGRVYSPRHDDRRLHVDAFPTRPTAGRRILRVFNNAAPDRALRRWRVGEPFPDFAAALLPRVRGLLPGQARLMSLFGLTKGRRTAYDQYMLGLHDAGKLDMEYQRRAPQADVVFPAGCTWMCYTDQVLHAALAGRCAFEQTFYVPVTALAQPEKSPLRVLERLLGRPLA